MAKAEAKISWVMSREGVARVARHLGCAPEDAELRIVGKAKAGLIKARGVVEGRPVSPLPAAWHGAIDLVGTTMRPSPLDASSSGASYEITNLELCFIDLVATGLLPAPTERARWLAEQAVAYLVKGVPLPWKEWQGAGATASEIERAGIDLARAIGADQVLAWGRLTPQGPMEQIPGSDLRIPGFVWVVRPDGALGTSPPGRLAVFQGRRWYGIEVDSATVRQAFPKPLRVERRMPDEAEQLYAEGGSEPAARAEESMPEPAPAVEPEPAPPSPQVEPGLLPEPEPVLPAEPQQVEPVPPPALKKRSRKKTTGGGAQTRRAIAVLNWIFPEITIYRDRYPDENEMTWLDVWDMFCEEYSRYAKERQSKYKCPSQSTVRRAMGRAE